MTESSRNIFLLYEVMNSVHHNDNQCLSREVMNAAMGKTGSFDEDSQFKRFEITLCFGGETSYDR
ncbi:hypothetical protein RchiOBHm_Chr6g0279571 [Rosa chinensis]|uniref:Uncharacterized protein n=1 Tax=Rosa chinensis TaxID=74649 RepID=A0A2P6PT05_ROSCH|nr:hypothetical protein RchiOBHm_Chr6g0279571 [Rosa chinensis]